MKLQKCLVDEETSPDLGEMMTEFVAELLL